MQTLEDLLEPTGWTVCYDDNNRVSRFENQSPLGEDIVADMEEGVPLYDAVAAAHKGFNPTVYVSDHLRDCGEDPSPDLARELCDDADAISDLYRTLHETVRQYEDLRIWDLAESIRLLCEQGHEYAASTMLDDLPSDIARALRRELAL